MGHFSSSSLNLSMRATHDSMCMFFTTVCFRFYQGRRTADDDRQIGRWLRCAGPTGRWRNNLISKCVRSNASFDNHAISPVVRQTLQHWGYRLTKEDYEVYAKKMKRKGLAWSCMKCLWSEWLIDCLIHVCGSTLHHVNDCSKMSLARQTFIRFVDRFVGFADTIAISSLLHTF